MSRLESNAEPSMEEILASIRKIIAEDSSGLRAPSSPPRPGAAFSPSARTSPLPSSSPAPQRGFMTREAFLKSSQPVDPEPEVRQAYVTSSPARPTNAEGESFSSPARSRQRDDTPAADARSTQAQEGVQARETPQARDQARPLTAREQPEPLIPEPAKTPSNASVSVEAVSVESVEVEADLQPAIDATPSSGTTQPPVETDTSGIEAQLSQLLSEDLNALREGRNKTVIDTVESAVDALVAKANEPATPVTETPRSGSGESSKSSSEGSDPFAFDLGPSPFAPKAEPARPSQAASSPFTPFEPPHAVVRPANGSHVSPITPGASKLEPGISEPAPAPKPRQTFAVPSVSATLGPSRKLEPLSEAFRAAPIQQEKPIPVAEIAPEPVFHQPEPVRATELPPAAARSERSESIGSVLQPASPPALTSSSETGLDRPMEDAVADLLRPLLKTWLAENMPKIVERALRREMSERLLPGQKNPRD